MNWEYWPVWLANIPTVLFWLFFAIKARKLFFFSTANPGIETGGVLGESKINILRRIPTEFLPITLFVDAAAQDVTTLCQRIEAAGLRFPVIAKPDIGERGFRVQKINNMADLTAYVMHNKVAFLIQEFIGLPLEISVMYYQFPRETKGHITSICVKEMLHVTGDGKSTIAQLMAAYERASLQIERFEQAFPNLLTQIPAVGEKRLLEPIGNHSRGTAFLNGNRYIDDEVTEVFTRIGQQMEGVFYGRFDMKCESIELLRRGEEIKILEFNGVAAEPAHVYDPAYPLGATYRDIYRHWRILYEIYLRQKPLNVPVMTFREAISAVTKYRRYMKIARS